LSGTFRIRCLIAAIPLVFCISARLAGSSPLERPDSSRFDALPDTNPFQQDQLARDHARFDKEPDPVHKAKLMVHLGTEEFNQIEKHLAADDSTAALNGLREYQTQADSCEKALDARGVDPEKHPAGYKELQISVREAIRRLDNMMVNLTGDEQPPFREVRKNLDDLDRDLIKELFPKKPGTPPGSGKSDD
jgi:hypothetical protein